MFDSVISAFESFISKYEFTRSAIGPTEIVYVIEDSIIEHISVQTEKYNRVVIEEIFNEGIIDIQLRKFVHYCGQYCVEYQPYYGGLGLSNPFKRSRYHRVEKLLPCLEIKKRFDRWPGFSIPYLLFELTDGNETGYALHETKAKQTLRKVLDVGKDLMFACMNAEIKQLSCTNNGRYILANGLECTFLMDESFIRILMKRFHDNQITWKKPGKYKKRIGMEEKGLKFCWINANIKQPEDRNNGKILDDIKSGKYVDVDRYEYVLPTNKWLSEQLVYEIVKQLYPKENVYYQYRPSYLFSGKGQLSYDVYIEKLRIAIEYQGKQHYEPVEIFGGSSSFEKQVERDLLKAKLSRENGVTLIYVNYWEDISTELIREKIAEARNNNDPPRLFPRRI